MSRNGVAYLFVVVAWLFPVASAMPQDAESAETIESEEIVGHVDAVEVPVPLPSRPVAELLRDLEAGRPEARVRAAWELARARSVGADGLQALLRAHDSADERLRQAAAWALGSLEEPERTEARVAMYDTPPKLMRQTKPVYPPQAFRRKIEGTVTIRILIASNGSVVRYRVVKSIPALDAAALACVRQWTLRPASKNGRPAPTAEEAKVSFAAL